MLITPECKAQQRAMCRLLRKRIRPFYADKKNRDEFEAWYLKEYGKPYEWKYVSDVANGGDKSDTVNTPKG